MRNFYQPGDILDFVAPEDFTSGISGLTRKGNVVSGHPYCFDGFSGVAVVSAEPGQPFSLAVKGVYWFDVEDASGFAAGSEVYVRTTPGQSGTFTGEIPVISAGVPDGDLVTTGSTAIVALLGHVTQVEGNRVYVLITAVPSFTQTVSGTA